MAGLDPRHETGLKSAWDDEERAESYEANHFKLPHGLEEPLSV